MISVDAYGLLLFYTYRILRNRKVPDDHNGEDYAPAPSAADGNSGDDDLDDNYS